MDCLNKIFVKDEDLAWRVVDKETVIIPLKNQSEDKDIIYILTKTATRVWMFLNGKNCISDIVKKVSEGYDSDCNEIEKDIRKLLDDMLDKKLIKYINERM